MNPPLKCPAPARIRHSCFVILSSFDMVVGRSSLTSTSAAQHHPADGSVPGVQALRSLVENPAAVVVTSPRGMALPLPAPSAVSAKVVPLTRGMRADLTAIVHSLRESGFEQKDFVETHGDFSLRGGFLISSRSPVIIRSGQNSRGGDRINSGIRSRLAAVDT